MDFVNAANQFAVFKIKTPRNWDASTFTVQIDWTTETEGAGDVIWGIAAVAAADGDDLTAAGLNYGTEVNVTDTQTTINQEQVAPRSANITAANTPAAGDVLYVRVQRRGGDAGDTFTQIAQLLTLHYSFAIDGATAT